MVDNYVNYSDGENSSEQLFFLRSVEIICSCIAFTLDFQKYKYMEIYPFMPKKSHISNNLQEKNVR